MEQNELKIPIETYKVLKKVNTFSSTSGNWISMQILETTI